MNFLILKNMVVKEKYIQHYPGFLTKNPHPDGLSVPCCFKKWKGKQNGETGNAEKVANSPEKDDYIKGPEKFPLEPGRWGFLPASLEIFLKNVNTECQISKINTNIKPNKSCLLRHGVETNEKQSFISCIADAKFYGIKSVPSIKEMKEIILSAITIDQFISFQNGNLLKSFSQTEKTQATTKLDTIKYTNSKIYKTLENEKNGIFF